VSQINEALDGAIKNIQEAKRAIEAEKHIDAFPALLGAIMLIESVAQAVDRHNAVARAVDRHNDG
jgi:uncharacterized protein YqhQ